VLVAKHALLRLQNLLIDGDGFGIPSSAGVGKCGVGKQLAVNHP
jgi:hypothetical protein